MDRKPAEMSRAFGRSPTFLVGAERQRINLSTLHRRDQHLTESYQKNKPLCFTAAAYQLTHPLKAAEGHIDADVSLTSPMLLGVADGVSQIAEFGIDPSELPKELLKACERLAVEQLIPERSGRLPAGAYHGPTQFLREAYEQTEAMGSTTALLCIMDNDTVIHGRLHPMIAVASIGDCEILVLRFQPDPHTGEIALKACFRTEMQRIDGNAQCPLQICRIDDRIDPCFDESMPIEVIQRGAAVHCMSAYEGDIIVMGSDGVFDNLFEEEITDIVKEFILHSPANKFVPTEQALLAEVARRVVDACHAKTRPGPGGVYPDTPIGKGGKRDDTCCVVGQVVEWTEARSSQWARIQRQRRIRSIFTCGGTFDDDEDDDALDWSRTVARDPLGARPAGRPGRAREYQQGPGCRSPRGGSSSESDDEEGKACAIS